MPPRVVSVRTKDIKKTLKIVKETEKKTCAGRGKSMMCRQECTTIVKSNLGNYIIDINKN